MNQSWANLLTMVRGKNGKELMPNQPYDVTQSTEFQYSKEFSEEKQIMMKLRIMLGASFT